MSPKKAPPRVETLSAESKNLYAILEREPDFAVVLIAASYLEETLGALLQRFLVQGQTSAKLLEHRGVVGTYAARTDLAYALGLISKPALADLRLIGELRNLFAHNRLALDFGADEATAIIGRLSYLSAMQGGDVFFRLLESLPAQPQRPLSPRDTFKITVVTLLSHLLLRGLGVTPCQRFTGWLEDAPVSDRGSDA